MTVSSQMHWNHFIRLSKVFLDLYKCIRSGAIKFVSVRSSEGNFSLLKIARASIFPKILDAI